MAYQTKQLKKFHIQTIKNFFYQEKIGNKNITEIPEIKGKNLNNISENSAQLLNFKNPYINFEIIRNKGGQI